MITAVDTNVLLDVCAGNQEFSSASTDKLRICMKEGSLVVCELVWAELAGVFPASGEMATILKNLGIAFSPCSAATATKAGETWRKYRSAGGARSRMIADFMIGAHALIQCDRLLTRDRGFYRSHFTSLIIVDPASSRR